MISPIQYKTFSPSKYNQPIYVFQSPRTRAINVGFIDKAKNKFVPGRLNFGVQRELDTAAATIQSLKLLPIKRIIKRFVPRDISTVTVLRETLACRLGRALFEIGATPHFGDAFIGASHIKGDGTIKTAYLYENIEGLTPNGLWIIADSICIGRNLAATMKSLLSKFHPKELLFIAPICSRVGINNIGAICAQNKIPTTFVAWGALFGVDAKTLYDMPWGHPDTEPLDKRDQDLMVSIYGKNLCMGGDFGNNYYCLSLALKLYHAQLKQHQIKPKIPTATEVLNIYKSAEILAR